MRLCIRLILIDWGFKRDVGLDGDVDGGLFIVAGCTWRLHFFGLYILHLLCIY